MGSSESKLASTPKPEPNKCVKNVRNSHVMDPRSPSMGVDRTPIQVAGTLSKTSVEVTNECPQLFNDPRSPSVGIARTPLRDAMRETVGSFARRLSMLFHSEVTDKVPQRLLKPPCLNLEEDDIVGNELGSSEPLLSRQPSQTLTSMAQHANLLMTPSIDCVGTSSPFVLLEEVEVELETEYLTVEEAEEAKESPLNKRLSTSLITWNEGSAPAQIYADVHRDGLSSPVFNDDAAPTGYGADHFYAIPYIRLKEEGSPTAVQLSPPEAASESSVPTSPEQPEEAVQAPSEVQPSTVVQQCPATTTLEPPAISNPTLSQEQPRPSIGIRCLTLDPKSPSQVVFKPQWLGKGFGTTGLRVRGVQAPASKGGSSPLAVRVAVNNENKRQSAKQKKKGKGLSEGRSPLQILKETNSQEKPSQMKLKASTPDRQILGQMDHRVLAIALDKENR